MREGRTDHAFYDLNNDNCDEYLKCLFENILARNLRHLDEMIDDNEADVNLIIKEFESAIHYSCVDKKTRRKYTNRIVGLIKSVDKLNMLQGNY